MIRAFLARASIVLACSAALLVPATPNLADDVTPSNVPSVRVLSYNVCGSYSVCQYTGQFGTWLNTVETQVTTWNADVLMLQELCIEQWSQLRSRLAARGYVGIFASTVSAAPGCPKWGSTDARFGMGTFVRAPAVDRFVANLTVPAGEEARAVLCARGPVGGRTTLICNTHVAAYMTPDNGMSQVLGYVDAWAAGLPIILGGDVNARPGSTALQVARAGVAGTGGFAEVDETDRDQFTDECKKAMVDECASGEKTTTTVKIDHILVTTRDFHTVKAVVSDPGLSDHRLLVGAAYPEAKTLSATPGDLIGDGRPDLVATPRRGHTAPLRRPGRRETFHLAANR
ncbi:putative endonuclease/exonuclease/phosphatase-family protein [Actinoplanes missouriensis 431]|uniref:Putative endonuclease/exonuclease/phosphatase-family protein n=1 Tax=Actinoplanes missouriensis (strain ATCC 14538 / DSM 43046 / CBS 188.64 / JCM 3121 / NBRC 102363 / NCIMB 12654 / NRRL B-3342 / UNCC 431) TaxID=512565 RepID=I0H5J7_ACTM4|nr:endonuclease/exonuclease/phosphatase family protein [Actinoplanes missouriensis]BAL88284.1 putative endonuclease/exonuclease/phosphatase-family protein [Actinoplanes missouriensis 431]